MAIEVVVEWGLGIYLDTATNALADGVRRQVQRTEVLVLRHTGTWRGSVAAAEATATPDAALDGPAEPEPESGAAALRLWRAVVLLWRRRRCAGTVFCTRCQSVCGAAGAVARRTDGAVLLLRVGGVACWTALDAVSVDMIQCETCSLAERGRGAARWMDLPALDHGARGRLLARRGEALRTIRAATGAAVELSEQGAVAVYGTYEQHLQVMGALQVALTS